ncbi:hypothetical protein BGZ73_009044 [Actinomortierella ambigua]|nr:hypothetical protein BGZ73_009044 [Actinomortierella ambigua]
MFATRVLRASRRVLQCIEAKPLSHKDPLLGDTRIYRALGTDLLRQHDPILMLDEFHIPHGQGNFPDHPHRGFETVTYMLRGHMSHEDFTGHSGTIGPGDLQWMTAGRGIMHCEVPQASDATVHGLQFWVNLPESLKMSPPGYRDTLDSSIPRVEPKPGVSVKVIAGDVHGVQRPYWTKHPTFFWDFAMDKNRSIETEIPLDHKAFVYVIEGKVYIGDEEFEAKAQHVATLSDQDSETSDGQTGANEGNKPLPRTVKIATQHEGARFMIVGGKPIREPVHRGVLYVATSIAALKQAAKDFKNFTNGFEQAKGWKSRFTMAQEAKKRQQLTVN